MTNLTDNTNADRTLKEWNQELVISLIPLSSVLIVYLFLGITGNATVLYIYNRKFKRYSESRFFIPVLAVTDLIACVVNCVCHLSETMLPVMYNNDIGCKVERYLCMITTAISMFMLLLISISRYLKICKPFGRQMTLKWQKISVLITIVSLIVISLPSFVFFGSATVESDDGRLTGLRCSSVTGGMPKLAVAFNVTLLIITFSVLLVMSILYFRICRVIFTKAKGRTNIKMSHNATSDSQSASDFHKRDTLSTVKIEKADSKEETESKAVCAQNSNMRTENSDKTEETSQTIGKKDLKQLQTVITTTTTRKAHNSRTTSIFVVITIGFAISFIPKLVMMVLESANSDFWVRMPDHDLGIFMFLYSVYIFNNFLNPFIYGFMDKRFQLELKKLCCC